MQSLVWFHLPERTRAIPYSENNLARQLRLASGGLNLGPKIEQKNDLDMDSHLGSVFNDVGGPTRS